MVKSRRGKSQTRHLVLGHLERISRGVFHEYPRQLTDLIGRDHGVYALYKGGHLYYVGLATNLRGRIKNHLRDKHARKWDRFSLYLVRKADHIKELESLIMRIADPKGNAALGQLKRSKNLAHRLRSGIKEAQQRKLDGVFEKPIALSRIPHKQIRVSRGEKSAVPALSQFVKKGFVIRASYKGKSHKAYVLSSGRIKYLGKFYNSPSLAGRAILRQSCNGWVFWRYRDSKGIWHRLTKLRKG